MYAKICTLIKGLGVSKRQISLLVSAYGCFKGNLLK